MTRLKRRLHKTKQAVQLAWYQKTLERLHSGELILGVSFGYDRDPYLNRQYLRIGFLIFGLYLVWKY